MKQTIFFLQVLIILLLSGCANNSNKALIDTKNPRIENLKNVDVIGISEEGTISQLSFPKVWNEFFAIYNKSSHEKNSIFYGITYTKSLTATNENTIYTYMVGSPTNIYNSLPLEMKIHSIPDGEYAVFSHLGPVRDLTETFNYIFGEWIPQSSYKRRNGDVFEYYDDRFRDESYQSVIEIWVPVTKR